MVTDEIELDPTSAAGNDGAFSLVTGLAIGCAFAGLLEFTRTFNAFGNLQFVPTEATERMFVSWTWAMFAAPLAVIASAITITIGVARLRTSKAVLIAGGISVLASAWFAARVWENVTGYLVADPNGPPEAASPLAPDRWPLIYSHGIAVLAAGFVLALAGIAYSLWRARPRAVLFAVGLILALGGVLAGGQFGFSAVAFLRLRNLALAVTACNAVLLIIVFARRHFDVILILTFIVVAVCTAQLAVSWHQMLPDMPHGIEFPWW